MNRKAFLSVAALTGLGAALLPKRGSGAPMPQPSKSYSVTDAVDKNENPYIYTTNDGYTVIPRPCWITNDPSDIHATIGVRWEKDGANYGMWFKTSDYFLDIDADALLYAVRRNPDVSALSSMLFSGETPAQIPADEVARIRAEYRRNLSAQS